MARKKAIIALSLAALAVSIQTGWAAGYVRAADAVAIAR